MTTLLVILAAGLFTFLGGTLALRFKDKSHLIVGLSAGAVLGAAFFDLIPEALELGNNINTSILLIALGFTIYLILDRFLIGHCHESHEAEHENEKHLHSCQNPNHKSSLAAGSLILHSVLDGIAIGFAFQISLGVGAIIAVAVLAHDFSDGLNMVGIIFRNKGNVLSAKKWLFLNSLAPVLGGISSFLFKVPQSVLAILLSIFAGSFLYLGAADLLPESHHNHPKFITTLMTLLGMLIIFVSTHFTGV